MDVPEFPCEIFSDDVRNFIKEGAHSLCCPVDFLRIYSLSVLSSAIGTSRAIRLKGDWIEPALIYSGIIAPPASKKSPAFKLAVKPVMELQKEMKAKYDILKEDYNCLLYTSPSPRDATLSRMPSSA